MNDDDDDEKRRMIIIIIKEHIWCSIGVGVRPWRSLGKKPNNNVGEDDPHNAPTMGFAQRICVPVVRAPGGNVHAETFCNPRRQPHGRPEGGGPSQ